MTDSIVKLYLAVLLNILTPLAAVTRKLVKLEVGKALIGVC